MILVEAKTGRKPTPTSPLPIDCITYSFSTGHSMTKYVDGTVFYKNKIGKAFTPLGGKRLVRKMETLVRESRQ